MSNDKIEAVGLRFADDGETPNHPQFELLFYRNATAGTASSGDLAAAIEALFAANGWGRLWRNGIYDFHHYHSTCHEALGVARGWAEVRFGGDSGDTMRLEAGDVAVLPAGTGHKRIDASPDFLVVGAYPPDEAYDMIRSDDTGAHEAAKARIAATPIPHSDPVFGADGGLRVRWSKD